MEETEHMRLVDAIEDIRKTLHQLDNNAIGANATAQARFDDHEKRIAHLEKVQWWVIAAVSAAVLAAVLKLVLIAA
jgi:hypothetical protein